MDTNILVHTLNWSSPHQGKAAGVPREAFRGESKNSVTAQVIYELYSVITDHRRVEHPLSTREAADVCIDIWKNREFF
ncbi:MAG: hypothetical protein ACLFVP_03955 [Candidatus Bathyarchaeia archaeon]